MARALGLNAQTSMHPQDKLNTIARLSAGGAKVLMAGDGLNGDNAIAIPLALMGRKRRAARPSRSSASGDLLKDNIRILGDRPIP